MQSGLKLLGTEFTAKIVWRPFQLNPDMPSGGMNRKIYRSRKFGSWEHSQKLDAEVTATGKTVGIQFRYDLQTNTPNTTQRDGAHWKLATKRDVVNWSCWGRGAASRATHEGGRK